MIDNNNRLSGIWQGLSYKCIKIPLLNCLHRLHPAATTLLSSPSRPPMEALNFARYVRNFSHKMNTCVENRRHFQRPLSKSARHKRKVLRIQEMPCHTPVANRFYPKEKLPARRRGAVFVWKFTSLKRWRGALCTCTSEATSFRPFCS